MAGLIPENILEDILSRVDIVELIAGYIPLKKAGRNFRANCPFHHEKTPSFMVSPDRQIYHCFGCAESGNAFKFLMRYERLEFREAAEMLAKKSGVIIPQSERPTQEASISAQIFKANEMAAEFYADYLESPSGASAKHYLLKRGISEESIKLFKLGVAPDKWDGLINFFRTKNTSLGILEKSGLVLAKDNGGYYDRFRNRAIFPIFDIKSRVIGFGARMLPGEETQNQAKYVNSPETAVYVKGRNLYGLNFAKDAICDTDCAVVVEGYLDFMIPFQHGLQNIVASSGTALTEDQARLLKRYASNVVIVYDPDTAGQAAALRALDIFIQEGLSVKVVSLPQGQDPDLFTRSKGVESFKGLVNSAEGLFDYKLKILKSRFDIKTAEGKAKIAGEMLLTLNKFSNAVLRSEYIKKLADELMVKEDALWQESGKIKVDFNRAGIEPAAKKASSASPVEKLLIKLMLEEAELIKHIRQHLEPSDFKNEVTCRIVSTIYELSGQGKDLDRNILINHFGQSDVEQVICESVFLPEIEGKQREKVVQDCIQRLKEDGTKLKKQRLHERIRDAQVLGDQPELDRLMREFHTLIKKG